MRLRGAPQEKNRVAPPSRKASCLCAVREGVFKEPNVSRQCSQVGNVPLVMEKQELLPGNPNPFRGKLPEFKAHEILLIYTLPLWCTYVDFTQRIVWVMKVWGPSA